MTTEAKSKDGWDKLPAVAALLASVLVPLAVVIVGNVYSMSMKDTENRLKYVELAVSILRAEPQAESAPLRAWAADVLNDQSVVKLSPEAMAVLKDHKVEISWSTATPSDLYFSVTSGAKASPDDRNMVGKPTANP